MSEPIELCTQPEGGNRRCFCCGYQACYTHEAHKDPRIVLNVCRGCHTALQGLCVVDPEMIKQIVEAAEDKMRKTSVGFVKAQERSGLRP